MSKRIYTFPAVKGLTRIHEKTVLRANSVFRLEIAKQTPFRGLFGKKLFFWYLVNPFTAGPYLKTPLLGKKLVKKNNILKWP